MLTAQEAERYNIVNRVSKSQGSVVEDAVTVAGTIANTSTAFLDYTGGSGGYVG